MRTATKHMMSHAHHRTTTHGAMPWHPSAMDDSLSYNRLGEPLKHKAVILSTPLLLLRMDRYRKSCSSSCHSRLRGQPICGPTSNRVHNTWCHNKAPCNDCKRTAVSPSSQLFCYYLVKQPQHACMRTQPFEKCSSAT